MTPFWKRKEDPRELALQRLERGYANAEAAVRQINERAQQLTREAISCEYEKEELSRAMKAMYNAGLSQKDEQTRVTYAKLVDGVGKQRLLLAKKAGMAQMKALNYRAFRTMAEHQREVLGQYLQAVKSGRITMTTEEMERLLQDNEKLMREYRKPEETWRLGDLMREVIKTEEKAVEAELRSDTELANAMEVEIEALKASDVPEVRSLMEKWLAKDKTDKTAVTSAGAVA